MLSDKYKEEMEQLRLKIGNRLTPKQVKEYRDNIKQTKKNNNDYNNMIDLIENVDYDN